MAANRVGTACFAAATYAPFARANSRLIALPMHLTDLKVVILAGGLGTRLAEETRCGPSRWSRSAAGRSSGTS